MMVFGTSAIERLAAKSPAHSSLKGLVLALLILAPGRPLVADWLIMRDGSRLETRGPWRTEGSKIILTLPGGTLASIAARDVDLERSGGSSAATETTPGTPPTGRPSPSRKPVLVLTNRDLPPGRLHDAPTAAPMPGVRGTSHPPGAESEGSEVRVEFWAEFRDQTIDGVEIRGILHNPSAAPVRISRVSVEIVDHAGRTVNQEVFPRRRRLDAGGSTSFSVRILDVEEEHGDPKFTIVTDDAPHDLSNHP